MPITTDRFAPRLPRLATAREVSQATGIPEWKVYDYARRKLIPHVKLGRVVRFDPGAVRNWIMSGGTLAYEDDGNAA